MYPVKRLSFLLGNSVNDYPRKLAIQVSQDNINWQELKANPSAAYYVTQDHLVKRIFYTFPSTTTRFIRLSQLGKDPEMYWSIHELEISKD